MVDGCAEFGDRFVEAASLEKREPEVVVRFAARRVGADGSLQVVERAGPISLCVEEIAEIPMRDRGLRILLERLPELFDRILCAALERERHE